MSQSSMTNAVNPPVAGPVTRDSVLAQAMSLPPADREAIAEELWISVDHGIRDGVDAEDRFPLSPAWQAEIQKRLEAYRRGDVEGIDAFEHLRKLREKHPR